MFLRTIAFSLIIAFFASVTPANSVKAQTPVASDALLIAVIDIGKIRRDAVSVKSIREQIINYQNKIQGEIQNEQEALRSAQQELAKKQTLLAPEAFADERRKFEQRVVGVQQMVQERRRALEDSQKKAMFQVENALNEVIANIAEKNDYDVILRFSQIIYVKNKHEITEEVLKQLDQKLPTIQVDLPKN